MNSKTKKLIAAGAALVLLVGGYFGASAWQKKKNVSDDAPFDFSYPDQIRLTDFNTFDIVKIEILSSGIVLEKIDDGWELAAPQNRSVVIEQYTVLGKLWSMANLLADSIIEENPGDLAQYGLDNPQVHAIITDVNGVSAEIFFGGMTPGRNLYYSMVKGDPKVYTSYPYAVENYMFAVDDLRQRELMPEFDPNELSRMILENSGRRIEVVPNDESDPMVSVFSNYVLLSPYRRPRGADNEKFGNFLRGLADFRIGEFVDDAPASLAPYGLDRAGRFYFEVPEGELDLRFGITNDGQVYYKFDDRPGVFTVPGFDDLVKTTPFTLADKFVQIFNITSVRDFTVSGEGRTIRSEIRGPKDDQEFFVGGRKAADQEFRKYYQAVIGLLLDAEFTGTQGDLPGTGAVTVTFNFIEPGTAPATAVFTPYSRDFYAVTQNGLTEFMVSRSQVRNMFDAADSIVYAD